MSCLKSYALFALPLSGVVLCASFVEGGSIQITAPAANSVFTAGQQVTVTVEPVGTQLKKVMVMGAAPSEMPLIREQPPYTFVITLPSNPLGPFQIGALAQDINGQPLQASVPIQIESGNSAPAESLQVYYDKYIMAAPGRNIPISLDAVTNTGKINVISSEKTTITSSNPKVVVIEEATYSAKQIRAVDYGVASIRFQYENLVKEVPVLVGIWPTRGDFDGNSIVDRDDVDVLTQAIGHEASGVEDPRDLSRDGFINHQDLALLRSLCRNPNCAAARDRL